MKKESKSVFIASLKSTSCLLSGMKDGIPKPSLKIRTANIIFWFDLGISRDYGLKKIFLRIKLFVFKIES